MQALLIILAAICKAFADAQAHHGYMVKGGFWGIGTGKFLPLTKFPFDSWHIANSLMIISFVAACSFTALLRWEYNIPVLGAAFILVFNLFYNKIFK